MLRVVLAIVAGVVVAFLFVFVTELVWQAINPMPAGLDRNDSAAMAAYVADAPVVNLGVVLFGWALGTLAGTYAAATIGRRGAWPGWVVAGVVLAATLANFAMIRHPVWFMGVALVAIAGGGWAGSRLGARRRV